MGMELLLKKMKEEATVDMVPLNQFLVKNPNSDVAQMDTQEKLLSKINVESLFVNLMNLDVALMVLLKKNLKKIPVVLLDKVVVVLMVLPQSKTDVQLLTLV